MAFPGKVSKPSVAYRQSADPARRCGTCVMYQDRACDLVAGQIGPGAVCDQWESREQAETAAAYAEACEAAGLDVAETTLILGQLDGTWKLVYDRREALIARHSRKVARAWRDACAGLDVRGMVRDYRRMARTSTGEARTTSLAGAMADLAGFIAGWLRRILTRPGYAVLHAAMVTALRAAIAEGQAAALALAADRLGITRFDIGAAYRAAYKTLASLAGLDEMADYWIERALTGAGTDVSRRLGKLARRGEGEAEMIRQAERVLARKPRAVWFYVSEAAHAGFAQGALALYEAEGVPELCWVTAGDGAVCAICDDHEANNPWPLAEFPPLPAHGGCRCFPTPAGPFEPAALADFLAA